MYGATQLKKNLQFPFTSEPQWYKPPVPRALWNCTESSKTSCIHCPFPWEWPSVLCALWVIFVLGRAARVGLRKDRWNWILLAFFSASCLRACVCLCAVRALRFAPSRPVCTSSMSNWSATLLRRLSCVVRGVGPAAAPGHYGNHVFDLCRGLTFHGFMMEVDHQRLGWEGGGDRGKSRK